MNLFQALILSVVEGFTEFLPISSTGHLILVGDLLKIIQTDFVKTFEISIQLGAILAVVYLYWKKLTINIELWKKIIAAFIPSAVVGFIFYSFIKNILIGNSTVVLVSLFLGGLALIFLEKVHKEKTNEQKFESISYKNALIIGFFQSISVVPGVSRAAATIAGGMLTGLNRKT
ncbi:undecaprenyl-diphosphate phosphatase, partial [Candidatus Woesebacteria bacterium]|nr:undecaprenyl-diphosphate phosphatase [Candidatus Woesebacteria bacterium]